MCVHHNSDLANEWLWIHVYTNEKGTGLIALSICKLHLTALFKDRHRQTHKYDLEVRHSTLRTLTNSFTLRARHQNGGILPEKWGENKRSLLLFLYRQVYFSFGPDSLCLDVYVLLTFGEILTFAEWVAIVTYICRETLTTHLIFVTTHHSYIYYRNLCTLCLLIGRIENITVLRSNLQAHSQGIKH